MNNGKEPKKELLSLTNDYVFRKIFGETDTDALGDFLSSVLDMPREDFAELSVENTHLHREHEDGKGAELDVRARSKSGEIINIEIQVNPHKAFKDRIAYYNSRIFSGQLKHGQDYRRLNRTISVVITDFDLFEENGDCFNHFEWYNKTNGTLLTDMQEINTLELPKLAEHDDGSRRWQWLKLLKLKKVEEMEAVARDNKAIKNVISRVYEMSEDERERRIAEVREIAEYDRATRLHEAVMDGEARGIAIGEARGEARGIERGRAEGLSDGIEKGRAEERADLARGMKTKGFSDTDIADITGLSGEAIAAL